MSEEESAAMDGLPAAEPEPGEPVEAPTSESVELEETTAALAPAASVAEADSDEVAADTDAVAEKEAAIAFGQGSNAADTHAEEQQQDDSSIPPAAADSASSANAVAAPAEAAVAAAEEGGEQQPEHAAEADAEHAPEPAPSVTADSTENNTAAVAVERERETSGEQQPAEAEQQPRQSTRSQASRPASSNQAAASREPKHEATAAAEAAKSAPAAIPEPALDWLKQHAEEEEAAPAAHTASSKPHKETAAERLTTPTAMRMLKTLQQTQGDKTDWHIASGVVYKSKKLAPDEMAAMVDRLCVAKHKDDDMPLKLHAVKLVYDDNGRELYEPVKEVTKQENISYMAELYSRCQETRAKTQQHLTEKYLQPLVKPKAKSPAKADKAPAAEKA